MKKAIVFCFRIFYHSCGLKTDGSVQCWEDNSNEQSKDVADMNYITAGAQTTCGVKTDGTASCWGKVNGSYGYCVFRDYHTSSCF